MAFPHHKAQEKTAIEAPAEQLGRTCANKIADQDEERRGGE
jgi:hypothetical protein